MKYKVTLKSELSRGTFYWVAEVKAESEEEATTAAEHLFEAQIESGEDFSFGDVDIESV